MHPRSQLRVLNTPLCKIVHVKCLCKTAAVIQQTDCYHIAEVEGNVKPPPIILLLRIPDDAEFNPNYLKPKCPLLQALTLVRDCCRVPK